MSFIEEKSESCYLSVGLNFEDSSEFIDPFLYLFFRVLLGASKGSMSNELGNWTGLQGLLSASCFNIDCDTENKKRITQPDYLANIQWQLWHRYWVYLG